MSTFTDLAIRLSPCSCLECRAWLWSDESGRLMFVLWPAVEAGGSPLLAYHSHDDDDDEPPDDDGLDLDLDPDYWG